MSVSPRRNRGPSWPMVLVILLGLVFVAIAAFFVYVLIVGSVTIPFTDPPRVISFAEKEQERPWEPPAGSVMVPVSGRNIPAYAKLSRDDIWDRKNNRISAIYVRPEEVSDAMITDVKKLLGRVLDHAKQPGYAFTEEDFMPEGTRPGLTAGIPVGMRGQRLELEKVSGLYALNPGDRFDLVATLPLEGDPTSTLRKLGGAYAERVAAEAQLENYGKQATVRVVVQNGVIVSPVETREIPVESATLTGGASTRTRPVQEVQIAIWPEDVAPLVEAIAVNAQLTAVPRSGHPDDPKDSVTPSSSPKSPFGESSDGAAGSMSFVETVTGKSREVVPVPSAPANGGGNGQK